MTTTLNVDPKEIAKFEALASRWWDRNSEFKPLHDINPLRSNFIDERSPVAGLKVLDVGCGGGIYSNSPDLCQYRSKITTRLNTSDIPWQSSLRHCV